MCKFVGRMTERLLELAGLVVSLFALLLASPVYARDHIVEKAWLEDSTARLEWSDVQRLPLTPYSGVLSRGFGDSALWVRLTVDPHRWAAPNQSPEQLVLRVRPVYLDDIQVFDPLAPDGLVGATGDVRHPRTQRMAGMDFLVPIARGEEPRQIWVRVVSTSTRQISTQVFNLDDLQERNFFQQLAYALYIGVIAIFMVWGVVNWLFSGERIIGMFGVMQALGLFYALGSLGYVRTFWPVHWPAHWLDLFTTMGSILAVSAALLFHVMLTREFDLPLWVRRLQNALLALEPAKLVMVLLLDQTTLALHINMIEVLFAPVLFLLAVLTARGWRQVQPQKSPLLARSVVLGFYVFMVLTLAVAALPGLAVTAGGEIQLYLVQTHALITAFLILLMLQYRIRVRNRLQAEVARALERSELQAQQERAIREEQDQLLAMLTHEIKTPLATMQLRLDASSPGSREIRSAIRDMNSVIERCLQAAQFDDQRLEVRREMVDLHKLVSDVLTAGGQPERVQVQMPHALTVRTDRQLLFIALHNLLENACKYAAADTPVTLNLSMGGVGSAGPCVLLTVANVPGASGWPDPQRVFEKYYRSPSARRMAGTGLGLYLVRHLVLKLGGSVRYEPTSTQVRFTVELPVAFGGV